MAIVVVFFKVKAHFVSVSADSDVSEQPRKRPRSSFTKEQLALLHSHFQMDPNPSSTDTDHLASMTGHTYRVIQVRVNRNLSQIIPFYCATCIRFSALLYRLTS